MANFIGRLGVLLGLDSAEFQKGLAQASKQLDTFVEQARTTSLVGATAFAAMAYQAMKLADEIIDTAKANDIAVDSLLKLRNALALNGGEAESAGRLLSSFTATIDKAAEGSFEAQKTFKSLGVSLQDLRTMSIDQLLTKSLDGLARMEDPLTRNAKAMEVFGKAAKGVDFSALNKDLKEGAGVTNEQAKAIEDAAKAFDDLAKAGRDFGVMLATNLGPPLAATVDYLKTMEQQSSIVGSVFKTVFQTITVLGANVAFVFEAIADEIAHAIENAKLLAKLDLKGATAANEAYAQKWEQRRAELDAFERRIMQGGSAPTKNWWERNPKHSGNSQPSEPEIRRNVTPGLSKEDEEKRRKLQAEAEAAAKRRQQLILQGIAEEQAQIEENNRLLSEQESFYQRGNAALIERQTLEMTGIERAQKMAELEFKNRNARAEDVQLARELQQITWQRQDAVQAIMNNEALDREAREKGYEREIELEKKAIELAGYRYQLAKQMREGNEMKGFFDALEKAQINATTAFERGGQMFDSVMGNMESAIDRFVETGKFAFADFARSVIQDLIKIQLKAQAIALINMGLKAMGFGVQLPGKASGGPVAGGSPYIVGENGPELFVPSRSGAIVPNNRLSDTLGGASASVVYNGPYIANMSAIDTQSATQFLSKNKQAVWSANQSAQRSLPVSR